MTPIQETDADATDADAVIPENPGVECPLCKAEIESALDDHLLVGHTHEELATLVTTYVHEREERGSIR